MTPNEEKPPLAEPAPHAAARLRGMSWLRHAVFLFRAEYFAGLGVGALATLILWYHPAHGPRILAIAATFGYAGMLYLCGFLANAIGDRQLDRRYSSEKRKIAEAIDALGAPGARALLGTMLLISLLLGGVACALLGSWIPLALGVIGIPAGIGYSLPPLRFKERGFLAHLLTLSFAAFFLPMFLLCGMLNGAYTVDLACLAAGYGAAHYGLEIANQIKDFEQDQRHGVRTLPAGSPIQGCRVALILLIAGTATEALFLYRIFALAPAPAVAMTAILTGTHFAPAWIYWSALREGPHLVEKFRTLKYARWQALAMAGYLLAAMTIRVWP